MDPVLIPNWVILLLLWLFIHHFEASHEISFWERCLRHDIKVIDAAKLQASCWSVVALVMFHSHIKVQDVELWNLFLMCMTGLKWEHVRGTSCRSWTDEFSWKAIRGSASLWTFSIFQDKNHLQRQSSDDVTAWIDWSFVLNFTLL